VTTVQLAFEFPGWHDNSVAGLAGWSLKAFCLEECVYVNESVMDFKCLVKVASLVDYRF